MKSRHAPYRLDHRARPIPDTRLRLGADEEALGTRADPAHAREDDKLLAPAARFRAERCLGGRSPEEDWLAARAEADGQPEWTDLFKKIDGAPE